MEAPKIAVGDIVKLNSGGPKMTVINADGCAIKCTWYSDDGDDFYGLADFPAACLTMVKANTALPKAETITFADFVQYGRDNGGNIVNGMPWSFQYMGRPVTHENDECYLIMGLNGRDLRFTPHDVLAIGQSGELFLKRAPALTIADLTETELLMARDKLLSSTFAEVRKNGQVIVFEAGDLNSELSSRSLHSYCIASQLFERTRSA
jgi:uncharacterized protein YodC (DUF2158 family)